MDLSTSQTLDRIAESSDASATSVSSADDYVAQITLGLQAACSANDSHQSAALLMNLLQHATAISQQKLDIQKLLQLIQATVQALPCCKDHLQVHVRPSR